MDIIIIRGGERRGMWFRNKDDMKRAWLTFEKMEEQGQPAPKNVEGLLPKIATPHEWQELVDFLQAVKKEREAEAV